MQSSRWIYAVLNGIFHVVHLGIIAFVTFGWIFPALRLAHLVLILLTLGSWFILGLWFGTGYCPVSDWHWKLKRSTGNGAPGGSYIHQMLQYITGRELSAANVDKAVVFGTLAITALSIALNLRDQL